jgi:hypothetical protein
MGEFFVFHGLFKSGGFFPEKTFPSDEVGSSKESVFKNTFNSFKRLYHISSIVIKVPEFAVVFLVGPPERVLFKYLVLFKILSDSPAFVVGQSESVFLEKSVYSRDSVVPIVFQVV